MHRLVGGMAIVMVGLTACGGHEFRTFSEASGLSFRYPKHWALTGFSRETTPQRLAVASYRVFPQDVEGDCGGQEALQRMGSSGVALLVIDYGAGEEFPSHPARFELRQFRRATYECFGDSYTLRFRRGGHDLQAHIAFGSHATAAGRAKALAILDSIE